MRVESVLYAWLFIGGFGRFGNLSSSLRFRMSSLFFILGIFGIFGCFFLFGKGLRCEFIYLVLEDIRFKDCLVIEDWFLVVIVLEFFFIFLGLGGLMLLGVFCGNKDKMFFFFILLRISIRRWFFIYIIWGLLFIMKFRIV